MIKKILRSKIEEAILEYQTENNVISGDIDPLDALKLEQLETDLALLIGKIIAEQHNFDDLAPSWYIYTDEEGNAHTENFCQADADFFFHDVSKRLAFDDCSYEVLQKIYYRGKEVEYVGWQPGMKYEYKDLDGNTVWVGEFPEWDH